MKTCVRRSACLLGVYSLVLGDKHVRAIKYHRCCAGLWAGYLTGTKVGMLISIQVFLKKGFIKDALMLDVWKDIKIFHRQAWVGPDGYHRDGM